MSNANALVPLGRMPFAGVVVAAEDNTTLPGATVHIVRDGAYIGNTTNDEGIYYFEDAIPGEIATVRYVGRETEEFEVPREPGQVYTHTLEPNNELDEVEVFGDKPDEGNADGPGAPGSNIGILAALGIGLVLLLASDAKR